MFIFFGFEGVVEKAVYTLQKWRFFHGKHDDRPVREIRHPSDTPVLIFKNGLGGRVLSSNLRNGKVSFRIFRHNSKHQAW